ncbi:hypothetical protein H8959_012394 [Pygathrix nigripes]
MKVGAASQPQGDEELIPAEGLEIAEMRRELLGGVPAGQRRGPKLLLLLLQERTPRDHIQASGTCQDAIDDPGPNLAREGKGRDRTLETDGCLAI